MITQLMLLRYFEDVKVPQIPSSTECSYFSCASEACTRSANCAIAGDSTVQFFDVVYVPTVVR